MSQKKKKERQVIQEGINKTTAYYQEVEDKKKAKRKPEDPAKPNIMNRFVSILIDAIIILGTIFGLTVLASHTIFYSIGYNDCITSMHNIDKESNLYLTIDGVLYSYSEEYDSSKTKAEDYYNPVIMNFYKTNEYAVAHDAYNTYIKKIVNNNYFTYDANGELVRANEITDSMMQTYMETQYSNALTYLHSTPDYVQASNKSFLIYIVTLMITSIISTCIFYLTIPLATKENQTIGQLICKLVVVNAEDKSKAKNSQIVTRYIFILVINFLLSLSLYILNVAIAFIPVLVNFFITAFSRNNTGIHEIISKTKIINKSRANPYEALEAMKEVTKEQQENKPTNYK